METVSVNWLAIALAALSGFMIGGLWYSSLLFGEAWSAEANVSKEQVAQSNKAKIFGFAFLFLLVAAINLGFFLADASIGVAKGALYGFLTGFGWVFMAIGVTAMFELKSWKYLLINGGYWVVTLTLMGVIIGAMK